MSDFNEFKIIKLSDLVINLNENSVSRDGEEITMPYLSFRLLTKLVQSSPRVVSRDELISTVWDGVAISEDNLKQRVSMLRKSLSTETEKYIQTRRGRGYQLSFPVEVVSKDNLFSNIFIHSVLNVKDKIRYFLTAH